MTWDEAACVWGDVNFDHAQFFPDRAWVICSRCGFTVVFLRTADGEFRVDGVEVRRFFGE